MARKAQGGTVPDRRACLFDIVCRVGTDGGSPRFSVRLEDLTVQPSVILLGPVVGRVQGLHQH